VGRRRKERKIGAIEGDVMFEAAGETLLSACINSRRGKEGGRIREAAVRKRKGGGSRWAARNMRMIVDAE